MTSFIVRLEEVRGRSHEARKRLAIGGAVLGAGLIGFVWLTASLATGAFALGNNKPAEAPAVAATDPSLNLAGAAGALPEAQAPAHIEIVDTSVSAKKSSPERTTIPF